MLFYMQFVNYSHEKKKHEEAKFENPVFQHMK